MTEIRLSELTHPWHKFPRTVIFYAATWIVGAILLTLIHVWFPEDKTMPPPVPRFEAPAGINPKEIKNDPSQEDISKAWDAVRTSDDIVPLANFAEKFPDSTFAKDAWKRIDVIVENGGLKIASVEDSAEMISIFLSHKDRSANVLNKIVSDYDLKNKYPLGFAIFYSDGRKLLNYGEQQQTGNVSFDPSLLTITFIDNKTACLNSLPLRIDGKPVLNMSNVCFGGSGQIIHAVRVDKLAAIDLEPLGGSQQGLAWVIGVRQP